MACTADELPQAQKELLSERSTLRSISVLSLQGEAPAETAQTADATAAPPPTGWFSKRSFVGVLCILITRCVLSQDSLRLYTWFRFPKNVPFEVWTANRWIFFFIQLVGCLLADFLLNRRGMAIVAYFAGGSLAILAGITYLLDPVEAVHIDAIIIFVYYAWPYVVFFAIANAIYDGAGKEYRSLWIAIFLAGIFLSESFSATIFGAWFTTSVPVLPAVFIVNGVLIIALAIYLIIFKNFCTPACMVPDSRPRGKEFVRHLWQMRKFWKNMVAGGESDVSFAGAVEPLDHKTADAIHALKLTAVSCIAWVCTGAAQMLPDSIVMVQMERTNATFMAVYLKITTIFVAIPTLIFLQRHMKSLKIPHFHVAVVMVGILASLSLAGLQVSIDRHKSGSERCADSSNRYFVVHNKNNQNLTINFGRTETILPNQTRSFCQPQEQPLLPPWNVIGNTYDFEDFGVFAVFKNDTDFDWGPFRLRRQWGRTGHVVFDFDFSCWRNETGESGTCLPFNYAVDLFPHKALWTYPNVLHSFLQRRNLTTYDYKKTGGQYARLYNAHSDQEYVEIELVPPSTLSLWYLAGPLCLASLAKVLHYWVFYNVNFLAPREVSCTAFAVAAGFSKLGKELGLVAGVWVGPTAPGMFIATTVVGVLCSAGLGLFAYLCPKVDVMECQRLEAFETIIESMEEDNFPAVSICTNDWMDPTRLQKYNISFDAQVYIANFMCFYLPKPSHVEGKTISDDRLAYVIEEYHNLVENRFGGDLINLLNGLFPRFDEINGTADVYVNSTVAKVVVKDYGVCWVFEPGKLMPPVISSLKTPTLFVDIPIPKRGDEKNGSSVVGLSAKSGFTLTFGDMAKSIGRGNFVTTFAGKENFIDLRISRNIKVKHCNATKGHTSDYCDYKCLTEMYDLCKCNCRPFQGEIQHRNPRENYCNNIEEKNGSESCDIYCLMEHLGSCNRTNCQPPCATQDAIGTLAVGRQTEGLKLRIILGNAFNVLVTREQFSYPFPRLLGDLGGYFGLFCGASVLSIAHAVYFVVAIPLGKWVKRDRVENLR